MKLFKDFISNLFHRRCKSKLDFMHKQELSYISQLKEKDAIFDYQMGELEKKLKASELSVRDGEITIKRLNKKIEDLTIFIDQITCGESKVVELGTMNAYIQEVNNATYRLQEAQALAVAAQTTPALAPEDKPKLPSRRKRQKKEAV